MQSSRTPIRRGGTAEGLTLQLHLLEGTWSGIVLADAPARNARVMCSPRSRLGQFIAMEEVRGSGVYLLTGPDPDAAFGIRGYIGESDRVADRLRSHGRGKSFWNRAYVAVAKDRWLSKSHIRFLEGRLLQEAERAPLVSSVTNDRTDVEYDRLGAGEVDSLESYIDLLRVMLPTIGCPLFSFPHLSFQPGGSAREQDQPRFDHPGPAFVLRRSGVTAVGYFKDGSFWVCKGSTARVDEQSSLREGYRSTRRELADRGVMQLDGLRGVYVFAQDAPFGSPSDAAAIVGTTSLNGRKEWRLRDNPRTTLGEWEAARAQDDAD